MDPLKEYLIPFGGLALGSHRFDYEIGDAFFALMASDDILHAEVKVVVDMEKQERMLVFDFQIAGRVRVECDRCLEELELEIGGEERLIVKFGETYGEESEEVVIIPKTDHQFSVAQYIWEYVNLLLPYRRVHPEDGEGGSSCDPEQLRKLEQHLTREETDPRWDKLKGLSTDN